MEENCTETMSLLHVGCACDVFGQRRAGEEAITAKYIGCMLDWHQKNHLIRELNTAYLVFVPHYSILETAIL